MSFDIQPKYKIVFNSDGNSQDIYGDVYVDDRDHSVAMSVPIPYEITIAEFSGWIFQQVPTMKDLIINDTKIADPYPTDLCEYLTKTIRKADRKNDGVTFVIEILTQDDQVYRECVEFYDISLKSKTISPISPKHRSFYSEIRKKFL